MPFGRDKRIRIKDKVSGIVRYIGPVEGKSGEWVGIELDEPVGSNDGSYAGRQYFKCARRHGVFIRTTRLFPVADQEEQNCVDRNSSSYILLDKDEHGYDRGRGWERETMIEGSGSNSGIVEGSLWDDNERQERLQKQAIDENGSGREKESAEDSTMRRAAVLALESLVKMRKDLEKLQRRMDVFRPVLASRQERRHVQNLVLEICKANEEKKYAEAHSALAEFKKLMEKYRIVVEE